MEPRGSAASDAAKPRSLPVSAAARIRLQPALMVVWSSMMLVASINGP